MPLSRTAKLAFLVLCVAALAHAQSRPTSSASSRPATEPVTAEQLQAAWEELASPEPLKGYHAACTMAKAGKAGAQFIAAHVPLANPDPEKIKKLILELDSDTYKTRLQAQEDLSALGAAIKPELTRALAASPSPEARERLQTLLERIDQPDITSADVSRQIMAVAALAMAEPKDSRPLLENMAKSSPWAADYARQVLAGLPASRPAINASDMVYLAEWKAILPQETIRAILVHSKPIDSGSKDFTGLLCDADQLHSIIWPLVPKPEERRNLCSFSEPLFSRGTGHEDDLSAGCETDEDGKPLLSVSSVYFYSDMDFSYYANGTLGITGLPGKKMYVRVSRQGDDSPPEPRQLKPPAFKAPCHFGKAVCFVAALEANPDCQPHILIVCEPFSVPPTLAPYVRHDDRWFKEGNQSVLRLAKEGYDWDQLAAARKDTTDPKWTKILQDGRQIRLARVWVCRQPAQAWDGDGNPATCFPMVINQPNLGVTLEMRKSEKEKWYELTSYFGVTGPIEICAGDGQWQTLQTLQPDQPITAKEKQFTLVRVQPARKKSSAENGVVELGLKHALAEDTDWTVGAIDKAGNLTTPHRALDGIILNRKARFEEQTTETISLQIDASDVDHYVLLSRPRKWLTFKDYALQPKLPAASAPPSPATKPK